MNQFGNRGFSEWFISKFPSLYILFKENITGFRNALINIRGYRAIKKNNLLDENYYLKNSSGVKLSGRDPILHYMFHGFLEGKRPNHEFDATYYLNKYSDVKKSNLNPLVHYSLYGINEGRKTQINKEISEDQLNNLKKKLRLAEDQLNNFRKKFRLAEDKLRVLEKEKENLCSVPDFKGFYPLKGKNGYLFLINDSNNEIKQHYDQLYLNNFNSNLFIENLEYKKNYFKNKGINYFFYIIPDKSYICRDLLPFDLKLIKRNYDLISKLVPDFAEYLDYTCYWKADTHINYLGGKILSYHFLKYMDNDFTDEDFNKLIDEQIIYQNDYEKWGDLVSTDSWSYPDNEKLKYVEKNAIYIKNQFLEDIRGTIPEEFKNAGERGTEYYKNKKSFKDLKVLILRDSSTDLLKDVLSVYFNEMLLYWDHWAFNKELIDWYKPDVVIEIRTERFLENMEIEIIKREENNLK